MLPCGVLLALKPWLFDLWNPMSLIPMCLEELNLAEIPLARLIMFDNDIWWFLKS